MKYLFQFMATISVSAVISVFVGETVVDIVDQKLQPIIEALEGGRQLPTQSLEPLRFSQPL